MSNKAKPKSLDLGEIAVQLMQAQPSETESLKELCEALGSLVKGEHGADSSPSVKRLVVAAKAKLDSLLSGEAADAEQALAAAVRLTCLATSPEPESTKGEPELDWEAEAAAPVAAAVSVVPSLPPGKPTLVPADPDLDLIGEFMTEANEHVVNAEAALLTLEENPDDAAGWVKASVLDFDYYDDGPVYPVKPGYGFGSFCVDGKGAQFCIGGGTGY